MYDCLTASAWLDYMSLAIIVTAIVLIYFLIPSSDSMHHDSFTWIDYTTEMEQSHQSILKSL